MTATNDSLTDAVAGLIRTADDMQRLFAAIKEFEVYFDNLDCIERIEQLLSEWDDSADTAYWREMHMLLVTLFQQADDQVGDFIELGQVLLCIDAMLQAACIPRQQLNPPQTPSD